MEAKWYFIFLAVALATMFGSMSYDEYNKSQVKIECLKSHAVEECKKL